MRKKIVALTGAGISKESGIPTYRDSDESLWSKYDPDKVSSKTAWKNDRESVLDFFNMVHDSMVGYLPNEAHTILKDLEKDYDVTIITQNVDDLHEKAGSSNILHLHGEINYMRSSLDPELKYPYKTIRLGDKCEKGSQLRPNVVLFEETPNNVPEAVAYIKECDILLIIGTSLQITYLMDILSEVEEEQTAVYYIDPNPSNYMDGITHVEYILKPASIGLSELFN